MANDRNRVELSGRLTHDPELRFGKTGMPWSKAGLASTRRYEYGGQQREEVTFVDLIAFSDVAETIAEGNKGDRIEIEGRLRYSTWEKDGQKRSRLEVVALQVKLGKQQQPAAKGEPGETGDDDYDRGVLSRTHQAWIRA